MIPRNLHYIRARAQKKGDRSVGWVSAFLGTALDIKPLLRAFRNETGPVAKLRHFDEAAERCFTYIAKRIMAKDLLTPTLSISYGGDLAELDKLPGYSNLMQLCRQHGVEVFRSVMSITGGVNVGEGSLAFAFASQPHELEV
jgi:fatty acid-binding protein DegV